MSNISRYNQMNNLKNNIGLDNIKYVGSIELFETNPSTNAKVKTITDVFIDKPDKNNLLKFYDSNGNVIAVDNGINIVPSFKYLRFFSNNKNVLDENSKGENIDTLFILREYATREGISLDSAAKELDKELDEIAETLGISKEKITSVTELENIKENKKEKTHLNENEKDKKSNIKEEEKDYPLKNISSKQRASLSQKIDGIHTLGSILGVPSNGELLVVFSDDIYKNENSTRFSLLIKDSKGNITKPKNLIQTSGIHSSLNAVESNLDGSEVTSKTVNSSYRLKGTNNIEYMITTKIGTYGNIELGFGQIDRTQGTNKNGADIITIPISTDNTTFQAKREIKDSLVSPRDGLDKAVSRNDEMREHKKANCTKLDYTNVDGDKDTGHQHDDNQLENKNDLTSTINMMIERIYNDNPDMKSYSKEELTKSIINNKERFNIDFSKKSDVKKLEEIVKYDYENIDRNHRPY